MSGTDVVLPGAPGYDEARRVWNAMVDRRPRRIVRCHQVSDVVAGIWSACDDGLEIGVRCGGHGIVGHAVPDGGLMLDLRPLNEVRVDPERRRATVGGGALLGALDAASQVHGLATTAGNVSHTGVGGLTLGGGMGWLARKYGLSCDNVVSFELVTATGEVLRVSADDHSELYWGLRGGGGNFGVVTEFEFVLHETGTRALSVELDFPVADALDALRRWRDLSGDAPREATYTAAVAGGTATLGLVWVGDPGRGRGHARHLRSLGSPREERTTALTYVELQTRDDNTEAHHIRRYWKGHYLPTLPDAALEALLAHDPFIGAGIQAYGGAIADVPDDATAFSHRDTAFEYVGAARWTDPADDEKWMAVARESAARLGTFARGAYVNTLGDDGVDGVQLAYPPAKLSRLRALKDVYDPGNLFHLNQNVAPSQ